MACSKISGDNVKTLKHLFAQDLQPQKVIELPEATRMGLINGDLWVPIPTENTIQVINQEAELVKTIAHRNHPRSVIQASNGDIILGSDSGLHIIDKDGKVLKFIKSGKFCDASADGIKFAALDWSGREISVWECDGQQGEWRQISCFKERNQNTCDSGTVLYCNNTVYCVSIPLSKKIDQYTEDGKFTKKHAPPKANFILLCTHDNDGNFITASNQNHSFILYQNGRFENVKVADVLYPLDVVCTLDGCVWILQDEPWHLVKYTKNKTSL